MNTVETILLVIISFGLIYLLLIAILWKKSMRVMDKIGKENIILMTSNANYFGKGSAGFKQMKGNGTLILTRDKIYFELLLPNRIIEIPLEKIEKIDESRSHLGKTKFSKLMKITYRNDSDSIDSCAWLVRNRKEWIHQIQQFIS